MPPTVLLAGPRGTGNYNHLTSSRKTAWTARSSAVLRMAKLETVHPRNDEVWPSGDLVQVPPPGFDLLHMGGSIPGKQGGLPGTLRVCNVICFGLCRQVRA